MPRGDGPHGTGKGRHGKPRRARKQTDVGQYVPRWLAERIAWWEALKGNPTAENTKYTNADGVLEFRRPGSQQR